MFKLEWQGVYVKCVALSIASLHFYERRSRLTRLSHNPTIQTEMRSAFRFAVLPLMCLAPFAALAGDQARAIINGLEPKSMNELLDMSRTQPDAALTSVTTIGGNRFRFLFVWPASNAVMTYNRISQSFAERFLKFAEAQTSLAIGYCLLTKTVSFGTATYANEPVNVAYRDVEVQFLAGPKAPCPGRYISASEVEADQRPVANPPAYGAFSSTRPLPATPPSGDPIKPFFTLPPAPSN